MLHYSGSHVQWLDHSGCGWGGDGCGWGGNGLWLGWQWLFVDLWLTAVSGSPTAGQKAWLHLIKLIIGISLLVMSPAYGD